MRELSLTNSRLDKRYDILDELGRGSYAEIFVARDTLASPQSPHREVVIKALNVFLQNDLDADLERTLVENFQNEAIALDRVRHPNIISRLGHGTARDLKGTVFHYLVLEYMAGGDLQKACREKTLTPKTAFEYIEQTCAGLRHAHRHGIIHRDIKPQNLLLSADRQTVKIADFGVARVFQSDAPITRVGTNIYAPPEHSPLMVAGESVMTVTTLTHAADIYSLAKTVYTLLTGESPRFYANQPITDLPMSARNEDWAAELKRILNHATLNDPQLRYQSIDEFWEDLQNVRRIIIEAETTTSVRPKLHAIPQPHVAKGYSPIAPREPRFDTTSDLRKRHPLVPIVRPASIVTNEQPEVHQPMERVEDHWPQPTPQPKILETTEPIRQEILIAMPPVKKRRGLRRLALLALGLIIFSGVLYGTSVYLRGFDPFPDMSSIFASAKMGTANTDINLRPEPSANNDPIGLVTKDSRVKILKVQGNWYQVEVVSQGRQRTEQLPTDKGWLSGKYIDLD